MENALKILMLEDLEEDAGLVERMLRKENFQFTSVRVDTREEFIEALTTFKPDLILSDHSLPQFNSIEALQLCREMELTIPFILITGAVSEEFAVMCIKRGADDYVLKSNLSRLPLAIRGALEQRNQERIRMNQQQELQKQNEELLKINRELDSFVYSISHNLRSPLSSTLGLVNIARLEPDKNPDTCNHFIDMIEERILKLDETLKDILDYSQNARSALAIESINLEAMLHNTFEKLSYMRGLHTITPEIRTMEMNPFYSDKYRMGIILANIVSNAIKYQDKSKPDKYIRITARVDQHDRYPGNCR
jgi:signal transduction histidine kinase